MTVLDVCRVGAEDYNARAEAWARSVVSTLAQWDAR
jgi:hypothetical protein